MAMEISGKLRDGFKQAKSQFGGLQERALHSFTDVRDQVGEVPEQLKGAWERVVHRIWTALEVPTREEFDELTRRLDGIERKLDRLARPKPAAKRATKK